MSTQKMIFSFLVLSLIGLGIGYVLTNSVEFELCTVNKIVTEASCINFYERVGDPLFYGMSALFIGFLALLLKPKAFPTWKKFAKWFIPIATLIFIFYDDPSSGDYFSPYPEQIFRWISTLYIAISILIIAFANKNNNN